jgi:pimeloyl-ACP methyl ester carboxylesterase
MPDPGTLIAPLLLSQPSSSSGGIDADGFDIRQFPLKKCRVDDISLAYRDFGEGLPIFMISGFATTMDMWDQRVIGMLARDHRIIIFDNRGTGYSESSDREYSILLFAADTAGLMEKLQIKRAIILGHSMGTYIAQELILSRPDMVGRLILVSGDCGGKESVQMSPAVRDILTDKSGTPLEQAKRMFSILFPPAWLKEHPDPFSYCPEVYETSLIENIARQEEAIARWTGSADHLHEITIPTLLITGTDDLIIPPQNSSIMAQKISGAWLITLKGGGHGLLYQFPLEFVKVVRTFLEILI